MRLCALPKGLCDVIFVPGIEKITNSVALSLQPDRMKTGDFFHEIIYSWHFNVLGTAEKALLSHALLWFRKLIFNCRVNKLY